MLPEDNVQPWAPNTAECFGRFVRFWPVAEVQADETDCLKVG